MLPSGFGVGTASGADPCEADRRFGGWKGGGSLSVLLLWLQPKHIALAWRDATLKVGRCGGSQEEEREEGEETDDDDDEDDVGTSGAEEVSESCIRSSICIAAPSAASALRPSTQ